MPLDRDLIRRQRTSLHRGCRNNKNDYCDKCKCSTSEINYTCDEKKFTKSVDSE